jgi:hypothetical protein
MTIRDVFIAIVFLIIGWDLSTIYSTWKNNSAFRKKVDYIVKLRWVKIYIPSKGMDLAKGLHAGKPRGFNKRLWPPPLHGGGPTENEIDKKALVLYNSGKSIDEIFTELYLPEFEQDTKDDIYFIRKEKGWLKLRLKRKNNLTKTLNN